MEMAKKPYSRDFRIQSTPAGFNIPKIKKVKSAGVLNYVPPTDRDASELLREVDRTCLNPDQKIRKQWKVHSVHMVSAASSVETRYREKRVEMKEQCGGRAVTEVFAFFVCRDRSLAADIAKNGLKTNPYHRTCLGDPRQGVYLFRYLDVALLSQRDAKQIGIFVFKVLLGRTKPVALSDSGVALTAMREPTPNYDAHVSHSIPQCDEPLSALCNKSQLYLYEYTDDAVPAVYPRQCLPYALVEFHSTGIGTSVGSPHTSSPKSVSSSAASAGWTSVRRLSNEPVRKACAELPGQCLKEVLNPSSSTAQLTAQISGPVKPSSNLGSVNSKDVHHGAAEIPVADSEASGWRTPLECRDNQPSTAAELCTASDKASTFPAQRVQGGTPRGLSKDPRLRSTSVESGFDTPLVGAEQTHPPYSATANRDPRLWRAPSGLSRRNPGNAEHTALAQQESDPMNSWGLIWNGSPFQGKQIESPSQSQHILPTGPHLTGSAGKDGIQPQQTGIMDKSVCGRRHFEATSAVLDEKDLASFQKSERSLNVGKVTSVPSLSRIPVKSALKKSTTMWPISQTDGKKTKKLSFQDYLKKKKGETQNNMETKDEADQSMLTPGVKEDTLEAGVDGQLVGHSQVGTDDQYRCHDQQPLSSSMSKKENLSHCQHDTQSRTDESEQTPSENCSHVIGPLEQQVAHKEKSLSRDPRRIFKSTRHSLSPTGDEMDIRGAATKESQLEMPSSSDMWSDAPVRSTGANTKMTEMVEKTWKEKGSTAVNDESCLAETGGAQVLFADISEDTDNENTLRMSLDESCSHENSGNMCKDEKDTKGENSGVELEVVNRSDKLKAGPDAATEDETESLLKVAGGSIESAEDVGDETVPVLSRREDGKDSDREETKATTAHENANISQLQPLVLKILQERPGCDFPELSPKTFQPKTDSRSVVPSVSKEQQFSSQDADEDTAQLLRIAKGLRGKPAQLFAEDRERTVNRCSNQSQRSRTLSPSSDSSWTFAKSSARSSKESTPDVSSCSPSLCSTGANTEAEDLDNAGASLEKELAATAKPGNGRKRKGRRKATDNAVDTRASESNVDSYALVRLAKGLRPGKSIHVCGLGKNPTDDPLPVLEGSRRKRTRQAPEEKKSVERKGKKSQQQDEAMEKKPKRKRRAGTCTRKRTTIRKKVKPVTSNSQTEDDIDYTDFQFEEPQEFCMSIGDDMETEHGGGDLNPAGDRTSPSPESSASPVRQSAKVEPGEKWGKALPLSYLGLMHWEEALLLPSLDPQLELVDLFKAARGQADFDNCAICQKVIDRKSLIENENLSPEMDENSLTLPHLQKNAAAENRTVNASACDKDSEGLLDGSLDSTPSAVPVESDKNIPVTNVDCLRKMVMCSERKVDGLCTSGEIPLASVEHKSDLAETSSDLSPLLKPAEIGGENESSESLLSLSQDFVEVDAPAKNDTEGQSLASTTASVSSLCELARVQNESQNVETRTKKQTLQCSSATALVSLDNRVEVKENEKTKTGLSSTSSRSSSLSLVAMETTVTTETLPSLASSTESRSVPPSCVQGKDSVVIVGDTDCDSMVVEGDTDCPSFPAAAYVHAKTGTNIESQILSSSSAFLSCESAKVEEAGNISQGAIIQSFEYSEKVTRNKSANLASPFQPTEPMVSKKEVKNKVMCQKVLTTCASVRCHKNGDYDNQETETDLVPKTVSVVKSKALDPLMEGEAFNSQITVCAESDVEPLPVGQACKATSLEFEGGSLSQQTVASKSETISKVGTGICDKNKQSEQLQEHDNTVIGSTTPKDKSENTESPIRTQTSEKTAKAAVHVASPSSELHKVGTKQFQVVKEASKVVCGNIKAPKASARPRVVSPSFAPVRTRNIQPRPAFGVCSQGSTKQRWQRWKNDQALQLLGRSTWGGDHCPQSNDDTADAVNNLDDGRSSRLGSEDGVCSTPDSSTLCERSSQIVHSSGSFDCEDPLTTRSDHEKAVSEPSESLCISTPGKAVKNKSWMEPGYWIGIDELKNLHQSDNSAARLDQGEIWSNSVTRISPAKLSRLVPKPAFVSRRENPSVSLQEITKRSIVPSEAAERSLLTESSGSSVNITVDNLEIFEMASKSNSKPTEPKRSSLPGLNLVEQIQKTWQELEKGVSIVPMLTRNSEGNGLKLTEDKVPRLDKDYQPVCEIVSDKELCRQSCSISEAKLASADGRDGKEDSNRPAREIIYTGEDLDVLGTPSQPSSFAEIRKKRLSIVCKSLKVKDNCDGREIEGSCGEKTAQDQEQSSKEEHQTVIPDNEVWNSQNDVSESKNKSGCPIPSFTSRRTNKVSEEKAVRNERMGPAFSSDSSVTLQRQGNGCSETVSAFQGAPVFQISSVCKSPPPGTTEQQLPAAGTRSQQCTNMIGMGQFGTGVPTSERQSQPGVGQTAFQRTVPVLPPDNGVSMSAAPVDNRNSTLHTASLSSVPSLIAISKPSEQFVSFPRQHLRFLQPAYYATQPPPVLLPRPLAHPLPPGTERQSAVSTLTKPGAQPFSVTSHSNSVLTQVPSQDSCSVQNNTSVTSLSSGLSLKKFSETGGKRDDSQSKGEIDVITWFTEREAATKNSQRKDVIDWFSDIIDRKHNSSSVTDLEPDVKRARMDFMESLSRKRNRLCNSPERSRQSPDVMKEISFTRRQSSSSEAEENVTIKKRKISPQLKRVCFKVGFSSGGINRRHGPLKKNVNLDSDSDDSVISDMDQMSQSENAGKEMTVSSKQTMGTTIIAAGNTKEHKTFENRLAQVKKDGEEGCSYPKDSVKADSLQSFNPDSRRKARSRWDQEDRISTKFIPQHTDTDDEMNDYAHALLEGDGSVAKLEMIPNEISASILKSVSLTPKNPNQWKSVPQNKSSNQQGNPERTMHSEKGITTKVHSADKAETSTANVKDKPEKSRLNLTDKPMEFLLFAKEVIMQKLEEENTAHSDKSQNDRSKTSDQSSHVSQQKLSSDQSCVGNFPSDTNTKKQEKCRGEAELGQENSAQSSPGAAQSSPGAYKIDTTSLSAITEEEINKLKNIVCQLLPGSASAVTGTEPVEQSLPSGKSTTVAASHEGSQNSQIKTQELSRSKKPTAPGRDWSLFLTTSRPSYRRLSTVASEKRNYYGDVLDIPVTVESVKAVSGGFSHPPAAVPPSDVQCSPAQKAVVQPTTTAKPNQLKQIVAIATAKQPSAHEPTASTSKPSLLSKTLMRPECVATQKSALQVQTALLPKDNVQISGELRNGPSQTNVVTPKILTDVTLDRMKQSSQENMITASKVQTETESCRSQKLSAQTSTVVTSSKISVSQTGSSISKTTPVSSTTAVAAKHSSGVTPAANSRISPGPKCDSMSETVHQPQPSPQVNTGSKQNNGSDLPSQSKQLTLSTVTKSNPSVCQTTQESAQSSGTLPGEIESKTLEAWLLENFPGKDPHSFTSFLTSNLESDVTKMSNKAKKNILFRVQKHLEQQNREKCSSQTVVSSTPKVLHLEDFSAEQIELELRLVEGCLRLLEATQTIKTMPEQQGQTDPKPTPHDSLQLVVRDFSNAMKDAKRDWRGRPHQRVPSDLLLHDEKDQLYTKDRVFVMLLTTIPTRPFAKLVQWRKDIEVSLEKLCKAACGNKTPLLNQERQRLKQLRSQRSQVMMTFTGSVSVNRLKKLKLIEKHYSTCQFHLLRVLGHESVAKMVFFRASYEAIQNHLQIVEKEVV